MPTIFLPQEYMAPATVLAHGIPPTAPPEEVCQYKCNMACQTIALKELLTNYLTSESYVHSYKICHILMLL